jgi:recombination protein RecA
MANQALAVLQDALRARQLDRTLTTALAPLERTDAGAHAAIDVGVLDARLGGGLPRGQLSEIAGPSSSGRTLLLLQTIAAATARGEIAALVDTLDRLDVASVVAAGVDLDRLLWIRGHDISTAGPRGLGPEAFIDRVVERALKALNLVLQAGGFGVVALDLADVPAAALRRIPFTTWLRLQRTIEGSDTACVLLTAQPLARSAGGLTISLSARGEWTGESDRSRRLTGMDVDARVVSSRRHRDRHSMEGSARVRCDLRG